MRVIVAGGRTFENYKLLKYKLIELLKNVKEEIIIISGTANGADKLGEIFAKERGYKLKRFEADWDNLLVDDCIIKYNQHNKPYNARAGHVRNQKMADNADALVAFWDGKSKGTKDMIEIAKKSNLKIRVIKY